MITILIGKSGSGKDTIREALVNRGYIPLVTTTSRPMREGETDGVQYHFVSKETFIHNINNDQFIEYRTYNTLVNGIPDVWFYGTKKEELDPEKDYVIVLDLTGAKSFIDHYGRENCFVVNIEVSDSVRKERAKNRGSFDETEWNRRLADDAVKFEQAGQFADYIHYNENSLTININGLLRENRLFKERKAV